MRSDALVSPISPVFPTEEPLRVRTFDALPMDEESASWGRRHVEGVKARSGGDRPPRPAPGADPEAERQGETYDAGDDCGDGAGREA
jgi:hypothetical protein